MLMRDGIPGPGWWIASDGRWYPPELHPDVRASAAVVVDEVRQLTPSTAGSLSTSFDTSGYVPDSVAPLAKVSTTNGAHITTRGSNGRTATTDPTEATETAPSIDRAEATPPAQAIVTNRKPSRSGRQRLALGLGIAVGTLALIVYFAGGRDERPSLESRSATDATTTTASSAPQSSVSPTVAPGATASTTTARAGSAPPTSVSSTTSAPSASSVTSVTSAAKVTPRVVSVFDLVKGNCLDGASLSDGLVTTIRVVDCTEVHTHEVYYSGRYPEAVFDATKISNYANDTCLGQFAAYVGIDYTRSRYQYLHIVPTQESWTRDNDRDVVCVAFDEDATIVGTIAGRKQ